MTRFWGPASLPPGSRTVLVDSVARSVIEIHASIASIAQARIDPTALARIKIRLGPAHHQDRIMGHPTDKRVEPTLEDDLQIGKRNQELDRHFVKETNESMDTMTIFFISSTSTGLRPDSSDTTNKLLYASIMLQRNPDAAVPDPPNPDTPKPSSVVVAINTMLFCSLILSLVGALGAMVVKQWIRRYETYGASSSLLWQRMRRRARIRMAMETLHLEKVITCIPYTLHVALAIFLVAVLMWTYTLNTQTMISSTAVVLLGVSVYLLLTFASLLPDGDEQPGQGEFFSFRSRRQMKSQRDGDIEKNADRTVGDERNLIAQPQKYILSSPADSRVQLQQLQPPFPHIADVITWVNAIKDNEGHEQISHALYRLRTQNWGQLRLDDLLTRNGNLILTRCESIARALWEKDPDDYFLSDGVKGARERARAVCLFIEWFYHQISVDQRRSLTEWPNAGISKALMYDPDCGRPPPSNANEDEVPTLEDITLGSSVTAKLHHAQLAEGAICEVCINNHEGDKLDVRVRIRTARDPGVYEKDDPPRFRFPWKRKMQTLVSACVSSDADCLLHYAGSPQNEGWKERIVASRTTLERCISTHLGTFPHSNSYLMLRGMLDFQRGNIEQNEPRLEWFNRLYRHANKIGT